MLTGSFLRSVHMSVNNIYLVVPTEPYKKYVKTVPSSIAGKRFNDRADAEVGFLLRSVPGVFSYDDEVLEVYSDREDRFLKQANKSLFESGMLKEYTGNRSAMDTRNIMSDEDVLEIASLRNVMQLSKKLEDIDSKITAQRILDTAKEIGRPAKTLELIEKKVKDLNAA
jgi:hypothetical protein